MTAIAEGFVFGLGSSLHCAAMCGPLVLATGGPVGALVAYHAARAASYVAAGALLGAIGATADVGILRASAPWVGVLLAVGLVMSLGGLGGALAAMVGSARGASAAARAPVGARRASLGAAHLIAAVLARVRLWPASARVATLGALTPLLPCGVSYVLYGTAIVSGSATTGAHTTLGFVCGSAPLLLVAHWHAAWLRHHLPAHRARLVTRGVVWFAAGLLLWRSVLALRGSSCCD